MAKLFILYFIGCFFCAVVSAQSVDSSVVKVQKNAAKYIDGLDKKMGAYSGHVATAMEKTLSKLSRWENKIKEILEKTNPAVAARLFDGNQPGFNNILQKLRQGEELTLPYKSSYNRYRDELHTSLQYLETKREWIDSGFAERITLTGDKVDRLAIVQEQAEALRQFIKERKKQLTEQALQFIGNSRFLQKINKEAYYYSAALKNYKDIFSDRSKVEEAVKNALERIPAFRLFMQQNSQLAVLFGAPSGDAAVPSMAGLQTRAQIQEMIRGNILPAGGNSLQPLQAELQRARAKLGSIKRKMPIGGDADMDEMPEGFMPNSQKTKSFWQRLELGANIQSQKVDYYFPSTTDIGLSAGYRINDKSIIGIGVSYRLGLGENIHHIHISHQGLGFRSFADYKVMGSFWLSGGYEVNYRSQFQTITQLKTFSAWQQSGLAGLTKIVSLKSGLVKKTRLQLLFDFLSYRQIPVRPPLLFRIGYAF